MKRFFALLLVLVAYFVATTIALADTIVLPGNLTRIESEAFAELRAEQVKFPSTIEFIADDAFLNASFVGTGAPNTYAQTWCEEHGFEYVVATSPIEDFEWETINGVEARIINYIGKGTEVYIPSTIDGKTVVEIGEYAFSENSEVERVFLPAALETIGEYAFSECTSLTRIDLPDTVTVIDNFAFYRCSNLELVNLSANLDSINTSAFQECISLKKIDLPESLTYLGHRAFRECTSLSHFGYPVNILEVGGVFLYGCTSLKEVTVPEGVYELMDYFIANAGSVETVNLPSTLEKIGKYSFAYDNSFTTIDLPDSVEVIDEFAFYQCSNLQTIELSSNLDRIEESAFQECTALQRIDLPDSLTYLGWRSFRDCTSLTYFGYPLNIQEVGGAFLSGCTSLTEVTVPEGVTRLMDYFIAYAGSVTKINLPSTLTEIGKYSFAFENTFYTISLPEGVQIIGESAFEGNTAISSITLPSTIKEIGIKAFVDCNNLKTISFNSGLDEIGILAFANCASLTSIQLPNSVTTVGSGAFQNCTGLKTFISSVNWEYVIVPGVYNELAYEIGPGKIFDGCTRLTSVSIPEGATTVPYMAFSYVPNLSSVTLPSTIKKISNGAFMYASSLRTINFPDGITEIGYGAFKGCSSLREAALPDSITTIGSEAFCDCTALSSFHFPENWTTVSIPSLSDTWNFVLFSRGNVLGNNSKITSIEIPDGAEIIPKYAFQNCLGLQDVSIPSSVNKIEDNAFENCSDIRELYISTNVTSIGETSFDGCTSLTIWCEYNSVALQHAIDHSIPYYYLSPDGINSPSGTLYKGDTYAIYGYARSSNALTDVTATIWDSTGTNAVQTISVKPGTKDLNLAGDVNAHLHFAALPLGNYRYTLTAQTEISEEIWANSSFTVAPPPLRVSVVGMKDLSSGVGNDYTLSGTIYSNYPITKVIVTLKNISADITYPSFTASPNTTTYSLSKVTGIDFSDKPTGKYQLSIVVNGNGESRTPKNVTFGLGAYDGEVDSEVFDQLISFVGDISNRKLFDKYDEGSSFLASLSPKDTMLMTINFRSQMCIDVIGKLINGDDLSRFMVKRYKKEIAAIIDDVDKNTKVTSSDSTYNKLIDSMVSDMRITFTFNENDSLVTKRMMNMSKILNFQLDKIEKLCDINGWIMDAKDYYSAFLQNYENSLLILEIYSGYGASKSPEFRKAVEELANDYESKVVKALNILTNLLNEKLSKKLYSSALDLFEAATDMIDKKLTGSYGDYSILLSIVNFAIDASMEFNNYDNVADSKMDALIRVDTFGQALDSYHEAFDVVRNGDTSTAALNRLGITYQLCCTAGTRMYDALAKTAWYETNFAENNVFMDRYSELWRMEYDEPFDNWR